MKRSMFGTLTLVTAALLASCSDPTGDLAVGGTIRVTPGFLTINVNAAESVLVQLIDDQGNALPATFSAASNNAAVATVGENVNFRPGLGANRLAGRFGISALTIDSTSITFSAGSRSVNVPVLVAPLNIPLTLSPAAPNVNDEVTATAAGFLFLPNVRVLFGGFEQQISSVAGDGSSVTFRATNAGTGNLTMQNIAVGYLPTVGISLNSAVSETFGPGITSLVGTDAIATAPEIKLPAGVTPANLTDTGPFNASADCNNGPGGFDCRIYKIVLTSARDFDIDATWDNNSDIGIYFALPDNSSAGVGGCDIHGNGAGGANFEHCTASLTAGTYYMMVVTYAAFYPPPDDVDASQFTVTLTGH